MSPGSRPRPSLSEPPYGLAMSAQSCRVSPGSRPRPSLSELTMRRVAGVSAPAFVERVGLQPKMCRRGLGPGLR